MLNTRPSRVSQFESAQPNLRPTSTDTQKFVGLSKDPNIILDGYPVNISSDTNNIISDHLTSAQFILVYTYLFY